MLLNTEITPPLNKTHDCIVGVDFWHCDIDVNLGLAGMDHVTALHWPNKHITSPVVPFIVRPVSGNKMASHLRKANFN